MLFLFESLPCETLCHRGLLAALPLHCRALHGTKPPACTFNADGITGNPRRCFCAVRTARHLALRKSWLCWLQLVMHSSSLVSTAGTGLGQGAVASLSTEVASQATRAPAGQGHPSQKPPKLPALTAKLPSCLVPAAALVAGKGQPCQTCPVPTLSPRVMAACGAGAEQLFPLSARLDGGSGTTSLPEMELWGRAISVSSDLLGCQAPWGRSAASSCADVLQSKCISSLGVLGDQQ